MNAPQKLLWWLVVAVVFCAVLPMECPAPLIWRKGEGWTYERGGVAPANNPKDQLELGKQLQEKKDYDHALSAYRRLVKKWPTSYAAEEAQLHVAECLSALGYHYKAYKALQTLIEKYPNSPHYDTALQRQFDIGNLFLEGEKLKTWRFRIFSGLDKAPEIYSQVVKNGPYSKVGPDAQLRIGIAYEKMKDYLSAVHAYEKFLERYPGYPQAQIAQYRIGYAYKQEARRAEYDQDMANQAIAAFTDYLVRYSAGDFAAQAQESLVNLKQEQSRGLFQIAGFYEKRKNYKAALIYFNDVIEQNPRSNWATNAQQKVTMLTERVNATTATP